MASNRQVPLSYKEATAGDTVEEALWCFSVSYREVWWVLRREPCRFTNTAHGSVSSSVDGVDEGCSGGKSARDGRLLKARSDFAILHLSQALQRLKEGGVWWVKGRTKRWQTELKVCFLPPSRHWAAKAGARESLCLVSGLKGPSRGSVRISPSSLLPVPTFPFAPFSPCGCWRASRLFSPPPSPLPPSSPIPPPFLSSPPIFPSSPCSSRGRSCTSRWRSGCPARCRRRSTPLERRGPA